MHAIEVANGHRTGSGDARMVESAKDFHRIDMFLIAECPRRTSAFSQIVMKTGYIVTQWMALLRIAIAHETSALRASGGLSVTGGVF
ncbi:MAG TPA: hypothetical protein VLJ57_14650 [Burkholderiaceae bacterium]|nr:hypothetical protein [Burkholderiaceae bacterium]